MILFPDYMTVYPLNKKKQTLPVSEAYQIIARFFFFITVILLQRKSQLKRLSTLKTWRRRTFSCFLFRLCIECSKSDHLVLHCYFDLESWLMSEFFSFKIWYYLSFFLCVHLPLCQKNTERTVEFWRSLFFSLGSI